MSNTALVWMQWREQRTLRWGAALSGTLVTPLLLLLALGAEAKLPGLTYLGRFDIKEAVQSIAPLCLALLVWPLVTISASICAFGGKHAGFDPFLAARPVSRSRVWWSRLVGALAVSVSCVALSLCGWTLMSFVPAAVTPAMRLESLQTMLLAAAVMIPICVSAAGLAASLGLSGAIGAAAAVVIGVAAAGAGILTAAWASWVDLTLGSVLGVAATCLVLLASLCISWAASTRGEPMGRDRGRRAARVFALWAIAALLAVAVGLPLGVRWIAAHPAVGHVYADSAPAHSGLPIVIRSYLSAWIVDPETADRVRYLPGPVIAAAIDSHSGRVAILTRGTFWRPWLDRGRVTFYDRDGIKLSESDELQDLYYGEIWWWQGHACVATYSSTGRTLYTFTAGVPKPVATALGVDTRIAVHRPTQRAFVQRELRRDERAAFEQQPDSEDCLGVFEIDPRNGTVAPTPLACSSHSVTTITWRHLSRDATQLVLDVDDEQPIARVLDLKSGSITVIDAPAGKVLVGWTAQGDVVWRVDEHDRSQLMIGKPGAAASLIEGSLGPKCSWSLSPDGRNISNAWIDAERRASTYDTLERRWVTQVEHPAAAQRDRWIQWLAPDRLGYWTERGFEIARVDGSSVGVVF